MDVLQAWSRRLFHGAGPLEVGAGRMRARIAAATQATPQLVLKVRCAATSWGEVWSHWRYLSADGSRALSDERGQVQLGLTPLRARWLEWRGQAPAPLLGGGLVRPQPGRPARLSLHVMASVPRGHGEEHLGQAVHAWATSRFAGHAWLMAVHRHQAHPHVHMVLHRRTSAGQLLRPSLAQVYCWRDELAQVLREHGLPVQASLAAALASRQPKLALWQARARSLQGPGAPPRVAALRQREDDALRAWMTLGRALVRSPNAADKVLAARVAHFVLRTPAFAQALAQGWRAADPWATCSPPEPGPEPRPGRFVEPEPAPERDLPTHRR